MSQFLFREDLGCLFSFSMGANSPYQVNHGRNIKNIKHTGVQHQKSKFFFLYYLGDFWEEGELFTPQTIICLMASLLSAWWHRSSSSLEYIYIYIFIINIYSNCPGSIVRGSVGMALLALSQFCRFNEKLI